LGSPGLSRITEEPFSRNYSDSQCIEQNEEEVKLQKIEGEIKNIGKQLE
jgi:hypothetical protein